MILARLVEARPIVKTHGLNPPEMRSPFYMA